MDLFDEEDLQLPNGWGAPSRAPAAAVQPFYPTPTGAPVEMAAMRALLKKKLAPKLRVKRPEPTASVPTETGSTTTDPLTARAQNVASAAAAGHRPGQLNTVDSGLKETNTRTENMPTVMPDYLINGVDSEGGTTDAHATRLARGQVATALRKNGMPEDAIAQILAQHPAVKYQGVIPSLNKLKAGLDSWQEAKSGRERNRDLLAQLTSRMGGQMDISPALQLIESNTGTKLGRQSQSAPQLAEMLLKQNAELSKEELQAASLEDKLVDHVLIPKGTTWNLGQVATEQAKAGDPPPQRTSKTGAAGPPKNLRAYQKEGEGIAAVLQQAKLLKKLLPSWKDFSEQDAGEKAASVAVGGLNTLLPGVGDYAKQAVMGDSQRSTDQVRKTLSNLQAYLRSGKVISKEEGKRLADSLGTGTFASKEALVQGVNSLIDEMDTKLHDRGSVYPQEEEWARAHGIRMNSDAAQGLNLDINEVKHKGGDTGFKIQVNKKTGAKRKVYSDGRVENL